MEALPPQLCTGCPNDDLKAVTRQVLHEDWLVVVELECGHKFAFPSGWLDYLTQRGTIGGRIEQ